MKKINLATIHMLILAIWSYDTLLHANLLIFNMSCNIIETDDKKYTATLKFLLNTEVYLKPLFSGDKIAEYDFWEKYSLTLEINQRELCLKSVWADITLPTNLNVEPYKGRTKYYEAGETFRYWPAETKAIRKPFFESLTKKKFNSTFKDMTDIYRFTYPFKLLLSGSRNLKSKCTISLLILHPTLNKEI